VQNTSDLSRVDSSFLLPFFAATILDFDTCKSVIEMHDRMIVADARRLNATLITRDHEITASGLVQTIW
jgi:hypothetical protein